MERRTLVVVGNGMVGHRLCASLRELDAKASYRIVVLGEEPRPAYDRVHLTSYFEDRDASKLLLADRAWYDALDIELRVGARATGLRAQERVVELADGTRARLRRARAVHGLGAVRAAHARHREARACSSTARSRTSTRSSRTPRTPRARRVIGGGLLGLEAARAVQRSASTRTSSSSRRA